MSRVHNVGLSLAAAITIASPCTAHAVPARPAKPPLRCDDSIKRAFKPDALTSVVLVKPFKKGDMLVISEPVVPMMGLGAQAGGHAAPHLSWFIRDSIAGAVTHSFTLGILVIAVAFIATLLIPFARKAPDIAHQESSEDVPENVSLIGH